MENDLKKLAKLILNSRAKSQSEQSFLVGISGIDASGKGFVTAKLSEEIRARNLYVANINADGWLNLPHIRFDKNNPAQNFYENGLRLNEMFEKLILPLKANRSVNLIVDFAEETATEFKKFKYFRQNIDIILLEGIFLFKNEFKNYFDLKIWIDCSFETALERAIRRSQENLSPAETVRAYETIYFPAQKIHFSQDNPIYSADIIFANDCNAGESPVFSSFSSY